MRAASSTSQFSEHSLVRLGLAALGLAVMMAILSPGTVSAGPARPSSPALPAGGVWQEAVVEVEVLVRDEHDVALLESLGYDCAVGTCRLELPDGQELSLGQLGLSVRTTARAIKVSGEGGGEAEALGEHSIYGADWDDFDIWDAPIEGGCGHWALPSLETTGAPADATITRVVYTIKIDHGKVSDVFADLNHWHGTDVLYLTVWNRQGGEVDDGKDDDAANDYDIELISRETNAYNGRLANAGWQLAVRDCAWWNTGHVDYWYVYVYYWTCDPPAVPSSPYPTNSQTWLPRDVDLNWADSAGATSYDMYFGTINPPPYYGITPASSYALPTLNCGTWYYWQVVARHSCGSSTTGPVWAFRTETVPAVPSVPVPADGATEQANTVDLHWLSIYEATSYDVYFGSGIRRPLAFAGNTASNNWALADLGCGVHYYWKIESRNACGVTGGPEWDFTTACCTPAAPTGPYPQDGATGVALDDDLDWYNASGATSYDLYFGVCNPREPPPFVANTVSSAWVLPALTPSTHYCWRIVSRNPCNTASGSEWDFTTLAATPTATPSRTLTPTHTSTRTSPPTVTRTLAPGVTPSRTFTPTRTSVASATRTRTSTPSRTPGGTPWGNAIFLPMLLAPGDGPG